MKYREPDANEWVTPIRNGYRLRCCDCDLIHEMDFRIVREGRRGYRIQFRVRRDSRATAACRRHWKGKRKRIAA